MESVILENNEYVIVDEITDKENNYVYLVNISDPNDILIRKLIKEENKEYLVGLKDEHELQNALNLFTNKNTKGE